MKRSDNGSLDVWYEPKNSKWYKCLKSGFKLEPSIVFARNTDNLGRTVYKFLGDSKEIKERLDKKESKRIKIK